MNLRSIQSLLAILVFAFLAFPSLAATDKPNFIIIFIDDLGFGDIEPFGSVLNETPHLNRMAAEGMKLTSFYSAAPVCTPSRAALLTGSYPKRVGLDFGSWRGVVFPRDKEGLNPDEITIAEILKEEGYATACFGKWHLGDQPEFLPTKQGFDEYFGIPYSNDMWPPHPPAQHWEVAVCPLPIIRQDEVVDTVDSMEEQGDLCRLFTEEAVSFIRRNQDNPFFVYLPHASVFIEGIKCGISSIPETPLVTAGNHARSARRADWVGNVSIGETRPLVSDAINMGCRNIFAPIEPNIRVALVIGENNDEVGPLSSLSGESED